MGSLAIVRYEVRSHSKRREVSALREYVRNIDRDERLDLRPPFDRRVELDRGVFRTDSDISDELRAHFDA